jgi:hypothetical protein
MHRDGGICAFGHGDLVKYLAGKWGWEPLPLPPSGPPSYRQCLSSCRSNIHRRRQCRLGTLN